MKYDTETKRDPRLLKVTLVGTETSGRNKNATALDLATCVAEGYVRVLVDVRAWWGGYDLARQL